MDKTFIGGYWDSRPEDIKSAAHRVENFLNQLQKIDGLFSNLKLPDFSKKTAMANFFEVNYSSIVTELKKGLKTT